MSKDEVWYYGSVYTRKPNEAVVVSRTRYFLTLRQGVRVRIDSEGFVYRPSKSKWFEWLKGTMKSRVEAVRNELERAERDLKEAQELLDRELELERKASNK